MAHPVLTTERLELIPATAGLLSAEMESASRLSELLDACVPGTWPPKLVGNMINHLVAERLAETPRMVGWSYWYWILRNDISRERYLVGRSFFSTPSCDGIVEIAYEVLEGFRCIGLATEGVKALVAWALSCSSVNRVVADAFSLSSVRVLEKCGFSESDEVSSTFMVRFECNCSDIESELLGFNEKAKGGFPHKEGFRCWFRRLKWFRGSQEKGWLHKALDKEPGLD